jgi:hypothetical protein
MTTMMHSRFAVTDVGCSRGRGLLPAAVALALFMFVGCRSAADAPPAVASQPAASAPSPGTAPADAERGRTATWPKALHEYERAPRRPLARRRDDPLLGNAKVANTVVVFGDFASPECRDFAEYWFGHIFPHVRHNVHIVFRYYPLNPACNPLVTEARYEDSCTLAAAAEAARLQGGNEAFWNMHDALFANQRADPPKTVRQIAESLGLDVARFEHDLNSRSVRDRIIQDISFAQQVGVTDVPAVFFNARRVPIWREDRFWKYYLHWREHPQVSETRPAG